MNQCSRGFSETGRSQINRDCHRTPQRRPGEQKQVTKGRCAACLPEPALAFTFFGLLLAGWASLRAARLDGAILGKIEYEEEMEPVVRTLDLFGT